MHRFHHILTVPQTSVYPKQCVVLDVVVRRERSPDNPNVELATMTSWVACGFSGAAGEYGPEHWEEGTCADAWWATVAHRLRKGGHIWLFAQNACAAVGLLGIWDLIEGGKWHVCGADHRDRGNRGDSEMPGLRGAGNSQAEAFDRSNGLPLHRMRGELASGNASGRKPATKAKRGNRGVCCLEDPPTVLDVAPVGGNGRLRILDVRNYGQEPLPETMPARERTAQWARFVRDMVVLLKRERLGGLQCTSASQSMTGWRYGYYTHPVQCHTNATATALEEAAYVGGRCEAYRLGALPGPVWHLDVSSMYPSVYGREGIPVSLVSVEHGDRALLAALRNENQSCIAEVGIETNEPCCPLKDARLKLTVWPIGRFTTTLCGPELRDAHEKGRIREVARVAVYRSAMALHAISDCVERNRRVSGISKHVLRYIKSLGVCLVGKLGQRDRRWVSAPWPAYCEPWQSWWADDGAGRTYRWRSVAWHTQYEQVGGFGFDAVPAMAATITSFARMKLLAMIRCAHWGDVYYVDTDSLFVSDAGLRRLANGGWLRDGESGYLRVVERGEKVRVDGIKQYTWDGREVSAGKAAPIDCYTSGGARVWQSQRVAEACRSQHAPDGARVSIPFERHAIYRHGRRMSDGTVEPLVYGYGQ